MKRGFTALLLAIAMLCFSFMPTLVEAEELGPSTANQEVMAISEMKDRSSPSPDTHKEVNSMIKADTTRQEAGHLKEGGDQEPATEKEKTRNIQATAARVGEGQVTSHPETEMPKDETLAKPSEKPAELGVAREEANSEELLDQAVDVGLRSAPQQHDNIIKRVRITKANGQKVDSAYQWMTMKVNMDFQLPDNTIKAGDTTTIRLPKALVFKDTPNRFGVKDARGAVVARGQVNPRYKTLTLSYTDYVEKHSGIRGTLYFFTRVDHLKEKQARKIPLHFQIGNKLIFAGNIRWQGAIKPRYYPLQKDAWKSWQGDNIIQYRISVNRKGQNIVNGTLSDTLQSEKVEYLKDSLRVYKGKWRWNDKKVILILTTD